MTSDVKNETKIINRFSISKERGYSGVGVYRQPDVPIYKISMEREFYGCKSEQKIHDRREMKNVCNEFVCFFSKFFDIHENAFFDTIRSGSVNCLPKSDLFISVFNTFKRNFVIKPSSVASNLKNRMVVCPKLDGVRAIGLWDKTTLLTYSIQYGFKAFENVPDIWSPTVICQIEWFSASDDFVITEIYAVMYIDNATDHVNVIRNSKHTKFGEGLYNGSNTTLQLQANRRKFFIDVNPTDSVDIIQLLYRRYPTIFTRYKKMNNQMLTCDRNEFIKDACEGFENRPTDGALLLNVIRNDANDRWTVEYIKLKMSHTIELIFRYKNAQFISMEGTPYDNIIKTDTMTERERSNFTWQTNRCRQAGCDSVFEFVITRNEKNIIILVPKCIREDKIEPDGDAKIKTLFSV